MFSGRHSTICGNFFCMPFVPQQFSALAIVVKPDILLGKICLHFGDTYGCTLAHNPFWVNTWQLKGGLGDRYTIKKKEKVMSIQPTKRSMFVRHNWKLVERVTCLSLETLSQKHQKHLARRCFNMNLWMFNLTFKCIIKIHKAKDRMLILFIVMLWVKQIVASFASSAINYITKKLYLHKLFYSTHIYIAEPVQPRYWWLLQFVIYESNNITYWWVVAIYKICLHFFPVQAKQQCFAFGSNL